MPWNEKKKSDMVFLRGSPPETPTGSKPTARALAFISSPIPDTVPAAKDASPHLAATNIIATINKKRQDIAKAAAAAAEELAALEATAGHGSRGHRDSEPSSPARLSCSRDRCSAAAIRQRVVQPTTGADGRAATCNIKHDTALTQSLSLSSTGACSDRQRQQRQQRQQQIRQPTTPRTSLSLSQYQSIPLVSSAARV